MPHNILYVDDEEQNLAAFSRVFYDCDFVGKVFTATSADEGIQILAENEIAAVVTDQRMPGTTGTQFLAKIIEEHSNTVRLILTAYTDVREIIEAINLGHVYYYITKPWQAEELKIIVRRALEHYQTTLELERKNRELELAYRHLDLAHQDQLRMYEMLITDPKTGVRNYHYFRLRLGEEFERAEREATALSLVLFDVDDFKGINDRHGLQSGDAVLRDVAHLLEDNLRESDILARYGGEEFAILMPELDLATAHLTAEKLRVAVSRKSFGGGGDNRLRLSVSGGVATFPGNDIITREDLIQRADEALYRAKAQGKDRVEVDGT